MDNHFTQTLPYYVSRRQRFALWLLGLTVFASGYVPAFENCRRPGKSAVCYDANPAMTAIFAITS